MAKTSMMSLLTFCASKLQVTLRCLVLSQAVKAQILPSYDSQPFLRINNLCTLKGFVVTLTKHTNWFPFLMIISNYEVCVLH